MNSYTEAIRFLYGLQKFGMKFGLHGINVLTQALGNPHLRFPCIHVAGTNGKGSTASMLAAIFSSAGYRTALYTSPHLVDFRERIRIDGKPISQRDVLRLTTLLKKEITKYQTTFFEATTAIAFQHFADSHTDIAIVEAGLGGRLDATNVVQPLATVITSVGLEHSELLGKTTVKIAKEKAGIVKKLVPCITGVDSLDVERVIREICRQRKAPFVSHRTCERRIRRSAIDGIVADFRMPQYELRELKVSLPGIIQAKNAAVALLTIQQVCSRNSFSISEDDIRCGFSKIQKLSGIEARLSVVKARPLMLADTAHNPQAIDALTRSLVGLGIKKVDLVFGVARDKDYVSMIGLISRITRRAMVVTPKTGRALVANDLEKEFRLKLISAENVGTVAQGVQRAMESAKNNTPILITGSNFVVGEALAFLTGKKYLTISQ
ncbi:MAG TPA: folylpolyglutamate synthase/dihydrofolate synthase family protein [Bacteroidota bacterium]|nr:folylpolyglutamate synthase/dihydrofolate synthase family protein [Bacteroidota bacterium]